MSGASVQQMADRVAGLMELRLRVRGKGLRAKLRRGGRMLPRRIRREAQLLADAAERAAVPKLMLQLDHDRIARAHDHCVNYLNPLGKGARVRSYLLDLGAALGLVLFATTALVVSVMVWRGLL